MSAHPRTWPAKTDKMDFREGGTTLQVLRQPNQAYWWVAAAAIGALGVVTLVPAVAPWLGFAPPPLVGWLFALAVPVAIAMAMKRLDRHRAPASAGRASS